MPLSGAREAQKESMKRLDKRKRRERGLRIELFIIDKVRSISCGIEEYGRC